MNKGLLVWNLVLTVAAGYLLFTRFSNNGNEPAGTTQFKRDSAFFSSFCIAYFEMDSVEANLDMISDVKDEISRRDDEYVNSLTQLDMTYNRKYTEFVNKAKEKGDIESVNTQLKILNDKLKEEKQELDQQYQNYVMRLNLGVKKKIQDFLVDYNKDKNYSYIVSYEPGLFYFKDKAYDITADIIEKLNEQYRKEKKRKG
jgi:outer membrane protein